MLHYNLSAWTKTHFDVSELDKDQSLELQYHLHMVMLHQESATQFKANVRKLLDAEQQHLYKEIVNLRSLMIEADDINSYYKLAVLQFLKDGNTIGFDKSNIPIKPFKNMLKYYSFPSIDLPMEEFGPNHSKRLFASFHKEVLYFIKKTVHKRLRFVADSNRYDLKDFEQDLLIEFLVKYRWLYPFRGESHLLGACKSSIDNASVNLIQKWTADCRARLMNDNGGFTNRHLELNFHSESNEDWEANSVSLGNQSLIITAEESDRKMSLEHIVTIIPEQHRTALELIMANDIPESFMNFLEDMYNLRFLDLDQFKKNLAIRESKQNLEPNSLYLRAICKYCGLKSQELSRLFLVIRRYVYGVA